MRFLEEWSSGRHFSSIDSFDFFGDTEKTHGPVGRTPSRCTPAFPSSRRSFLEKFTALGGVAEQILTRFGETQPLWWNWALRAWPSLTRLEDGLYRLTSFPGLLLDPQALIAGDTRRLRAVVDLGLATPEHAEFVARLAEGPAAGS
jgi:hypothetical protein